MAQQNGSFDGSPESIHGHPQPKNFLRPCLLLLLGEEPAYGYELREKLAPMSPKQWDMGTVYRTLNNMEEDGLVASSWERSAEGPRRRRYDITPAGRAALDGLAYEMSGMRDLIAEFLDRYRVDLGADVTPWLQLAAGPADAGQTGPPAQPAADPDVDLSGLPLRMEALRLEA